jgi:hypothetical protein
MSLSQDEIRSLCTKPELALVVASQSPALEKLSLAELKKHASNTRKLTDKWQGLSRSQSRTESRKSGSPDLDSRSHAKQSLLKETLAKFEARLKVMESVPSVAPNTAKPTATVRAKAARVVRQTTKKDLHRTKQSINAVAAPASKVAPAPKAAATTAAKTTKKAKPKSAPVKKTTTTKAAATKAALVKTAAARAAKKGPAAAAAASKPAPAKAASTKVKSSTAAQRTQIAGKAKANRVAISNRTSNIAGHVSGKGKRVQAKRDSKGR